MSEPAISVVTRYVVQRVREQEGSLSRTKLVKLLYLIDVEYYRRYRETLTGWQWRFHHYGPYAFEFETFLQTLPLDVDEAQVSTQTGRRAYAYRAWDDCPCLLLRRARKGQRAGNQSSGILSSNRA